MLNVLVWHLQKHSLQIICIESCKINEFLYCKSSIRQLRPAKTFLCSTVDVVYSTVISCEHIPVLQNLGYGIPRFCRINYQSTVTTRSKLSPISIVGCYSRTNHYRSDTETVLCSTAVSCGHVPVVKILLYRGIDASLVDSDGQIAAELTDDPEVKKLLEAG